MAPRAGWKKVAATVTLTATTFSYTATAAQAFFPPWWPGNPQAVSPPAVPPQVVPPVPPPPFVPPVAPPPVIVPPVVPPPQTVPPVCPPGHAVPEPSTFVAGLAGLAAAAGWAARRRKLGA